MNRPAVVVTGASSGIGQACIGRLVQRGFTVYATVRNQDDAALLEERYGSARTAPPPPSPGHAEVPAESHGALARSHPVPGAVIPVMLDVTESDSIVALRQLLEHHLADSGLYGLINNAGMAVPGPVELVPVEELRRQMEVNLLGPVALTQQLLPLLRKGPGRIVNMSSRAGRLTLPFMGIYSASKYALEAVSDALRLELRPHGVRVILVEPGTIKTRVFSKALGYLEHLQRHGTSEAQALYQEQFLGAREYTRRADEKGIAPDGVAKVVLRALTAKRPRARYPVGWDARAVVCAKSWLPDPILDWTIDAVFRHTIKNHRRD